MFSAACVMSGNSLLIDTNIIIYILAGRSELAAHIEGRKVFVSFISELEALSYPGLSVDDVRNVQTFISRCSVVGLSEGLKRDTIRLRKAHRMKLPDAIVGATATTLGIPLLTADKRFERLKKEVVLDLFEI